jgi:mRNA interferase HicA
VRTFSVTAVRLAMKYSEFKRWLAAQGARFRPGNGSHLHVELNGRHSVFPFHGSKEIPNSLVKAIKKDLDLD